MCRGPGHAPGAPALRHCGALAEPGGRAVDSTLERGHPRPDRAAHATSSALAQPRPCCARHAAQVALAAGALFVAALAAVHLVKPDLDPTWRPISEYALGDFGWLMTLAFVAWAASAMILAVTLGAHIRTRVGRIGQGFLLLGGLGPLLAAIFP